MLKHHASAGDGQDDVSAVEDDVVRSCAAPSTSVRGALRQSNPSRNRHCCEMNCFAGVAMTLLEPGGLPTRRDATNQHVGQHFAFPEIQITAIFHPILSPRKGRWPVTERWGRSCGGRDGIVRAMGRQGGINSVSGLQDVLTSGAGAYGKIVWIRCLSGRHQVGGRQVGPTGRG